MNAEDYVNSEVKRLAQQISPEKAAELLREAMELEASVGPRAPSLEEEVKANDPYAPNQNSSNFSTEFQRFEPRSCAFLKKQDLKMSEAANGQWPGNDYRVSVTGTDSSMVRFEIFLTLARQQVGR